MKLKILEPEFSVCQTEDLSLVRFDSDFCFLSKTDDELSLVCPARDVPENTVKREDGWKAMKIEGVLDFSLIGILSGISFVLAENKIGIFVVSTYNTDYILVKSENLHRAIDVLRAADYVITE